MPRFALTAILLAGLVATVGVQAAESLPLAMTYPPKGIRVNAPQVRFSGHTSPRARVTANGRRVRVYPSGAFVGLASLAEGRNTLRIRAASGERVRALDWPVVYAPPPRPLPAKPTAIADDSLLPGEDCVLVAGDRIALQFRGSPGGKAWLSLGRLHRRLEMPETESGIYQVDVVVSPDDDLQPTEPVFHLRGRDGRTVSRTLPNTVAIREAGAPCCGEVSAFRTRLYQQPGNTFVQTLPQGAPLLFGTRRGGWQQIWLGLSRFWLPADDLLVHPTLDSQAEAELADTLVLSTDDALRLRVFSSRPLPVRIQQTDETNLRLEYYPVDEHCQPLPVLGGDPMLVSATWERPSADTCVLHAQLAARMAWGYGVEYGPGCIDLRLPRCPLRGPPGDLTGLIVVLDPGHGGYDSGCVGPTGLSEKTCNLRQARLVAGLLRQRGATVELTRDGDVFVSLEERVQRAQAAGAELFVSLHFNSLDATTDPLIARGSSVWYRHDYNRPLAEALQARLLSLGLDDHGVKQNDLRVLLSSDFPCVLVEHLFLSHPLDEMEVMPLAFRRRLAQAVVDGIVEWADQSGPIRVGRTLLFGMTGLETHPTHPSGEAP